MLTEEDAITKFKSVGSREMQIRLEIGKRQRGILALKRELRSLEGWMPVKQLSRILRPKAKRKLVHKELGGCGFLPLITRAVVFLSSDDADLANPNTKTAYTAEITVLLGQNKIGVGSGTTRRVLLDVENRRFLGLGGEENWFNHKNGNSNTQYNQQGPIPIHAPVPFINEKEVIDKLIGIIEKSI